MAKSTVKHVTAMVFGIPDQDSRYDQAWTDMYSGLAALAKSNVDVHFMRELKPIGSYRKRARIEVISADSVDLNLLERLTTHVGEVISRYFPKTEEVMVYAAVIPEGMAARWENGSLVGNQEQLEKV